MNINTFATQARVIDEFDVTFTSGHVMPITICKTDGDTVDFETHPNAVRFHISAKKSFEGKEDMPAEDITLFTAHILVIQHRTRKLQPVTAEQKAAWNQSLKSLTTNTVQ